MEQCADVVDVDRVAGGDAGNLEHGDTWVVELAHELIPVLGDPDIENRHAEVGPRQELAVGVADAPSVAAGYPMSGDGAREPLEAGHGQGSVSHIPPGSDLVGAVRCP